MGKNRSKFKRRLGRLNIIVMRPAGQTLSFSLSPIFLGFVGLLALLLGLGALAAIWLHIDLYFDHKLLMAEQKETEARLLRLSDERGYQAEVSAAYKELLASLELQPAAGREIPASEPQAQAEPEAQASGAGKALAAALKPEAASESDPAALTAADWAALFPTPVNSPLQKLDIEKFRVRGEQFSFILVNCGGESAEAALGNLLLAFTVREANGQKRLTAYPSFDLRDPAADFSRGPSYNIRSSKLIGGQLALPQGAHIEDMTVVAKARDGQIVMKKTFVPDAS